jgi:two-component system chemotaxis response regulator CheY
MVVDDSRAVRMLLGTILRGLGYEVMEASNGQEALEALDACISLPELILADWNMPVMNGLDLLKAIRARPRFGSTPVIMVTTETEQDQMVIALEAGANEYVMKPFTPEILVDKLRMVGAAV